ncbi:MAG: UDP-N-acetylmuramoyl-L-alanine--D-glutamate ligase [Candidatus Marinimicrobia bacterium]|jgi:UDP-N-acetylmuramoylalanine--D-glutamate ligase|nr:UDP-N-acetylmuramoyl-L-alanine--D-glutamate ligase [Candidatus Neomarinimicrobiota bacterium]
MINVKNKNITVLGAKRSGIGVAKLLSHYQANVFISDNNKNAIDGNTKQLLKNLNIESEFGQHSEKIYDSDFIIISPGIPDTIPVIQKIKQLNIPILSEIEIAYNFANSQIIAITGSNGKSTTTKLTADILNKSKIPAIACGNIGLAFSEAVFISLKKNTKPIYVVEISSFQLENIINFRPNVAVLLNITPDHLDRYNSFNEYAKTKVKIFINQSKNDIAILNIDDENVSNFSKPKSKIINISMRENKDQFAYFDKTYFHYKINSQWHKLNKNKIQLIGEHNQYNILSAFSAAYSFLNNEIGTVSSLSTFKTITHRIEFCGSINGVSFYNDSKATNTDSVKFALKSFKGPIHLILGGKDKDTNFSELQELINKNVKTVYTIGETSNKINSQLKNINIVNSKVLDLAMKTALKNANKNEIILLSPSCSSYDQYVNFEKRGEHFKTIFDKLKKNNKDEN